MIKIRKLKHREWVIPITPKRDKITIRLSADYETGSLIIRHAYYIRNTKERALKVITSSGEYNEYAIF